MILGKTYLNRIENKLYLGNILIYDPAPYSITPIMTNFRVEEANKDRIYFDTPLGPVTGLTTQGFIVSGRTVSAIDTVNNYITLDSAFNYWDNNKIRLIGGDSIVYDFTDEVIDNQINEPDATDQTLYATNNSSLNTAIGQATAGTTVWIKKGNYTGEFVFPTSGTVDNPIKFIGYDTVDGDLDDVKIVDSFTYTSPANGASHIDSSKWPVFTGLNDGNGTDSGMYINGDSYLIFKNIQVQKYYRNFWSIGAVTGLVYENCTAALAFKTSDGSGYGFYYGTTDTGSKIRVKDCVSFDNGSVNIRLYGSYNRVTKSKTYTGLSGGANSDYQINNYDANYSIIDNNETHAIDALGSVGHGIGLKNKSTTSLGVDTLIVDNDIYQDQGEALFLAHQGTSHNTLKRNNIYGQRDLSQTVKGLQIRNGTHDNIIEQNYVEYALEGMALVCNTENQPISSGMVGYNNTFRNNVLKDVNRTIATSNGNASVYDMDNVKIYNNTFYNITGSLFYQTQVGMTFTNCEFKNNIVYGDGSISLYASQATANDYVQTYNDYYNTGQSTPSGTGNISVDPDFVDLVDYVPQADLLVQKILNYDWKGNERDAQSSMGGSIMLGESPAPDTKPPIYQSSVVENSYPLTLDILYDEALDGTSVPANSDFVVNDGANNPVTNVSINGNEVKLILTNVITEGLTITLSYTKGTNPIQDSSGNEASNLSNEVVTNNVAPDIGDLFPQDNAAALSDDNSVGTWEAERLAVLSVDESDFSDGLRSIKVVSGAQTYSNAFISFPGLENGATYEIRGMFKCDSFNAASPQQFYFGDGNGWTVQQELDIQATVWTEYVFTATTNSTSPHINLRANRGVATAGQTLWADKVTVTKIS